MQRIWWLNSTLCAKVHLMTFDPYTKCPDGQIAEQVKNAQETLGYQKIIVPKIPPEGGGGAIASSKSNNSTVDNIIIITKTRCYRGDWYLLRTKLN